jgi:hypothetical protein
MTRSSRPRKIFRALLAAAFLFSGLFFLLLPGLTVVRAVFFDKGLRAPGGSAFAFRVHRSLSMEYPAYARERLASGAAKELTLAQIAETEWPLFGATFYLWATEALQDSWDANPKLTKTAPKVYALEAIEAATALVIDPNQATWVQKHWGAEDYLKRENVFYRMLVIASLTSHHCLTGSDGHLGFLREQVTTLAAELEASPHGLLDDYPGQCYPSDVMGAIAAILQADPILGTDHRAFADRAIRGFSGSSVAAVGLPPYAADARSGLPLDASRGCSNAHFMTFAPQVWPEAAKGWFDLNVEHFWQRNGFLAGFREFPKGTGDAYYADVDSGPVIGGFGMSASSFGTGAARANGRFDLAYPLSAELIAASWPLPNGTLLMPRLFSNGAHAPLLGESAIVFQLSREPFSGEATEAKSRRCPGFVYLLLLFYFGLGYFVTKRAARSLFRTLKRGAAA